MGKQSRLRRRRKEDRLITNLKKIIRELLDEPRYIIVDADGRQVCPDEELAARRNDVIKTEEK